MIQCGRPLFLLSSDYLFFYSKLEKFKRYHLGSMIVFSG